MDKDVQSIIQELRLFKHDIAIRLRGIVIDPLEEMNERGAAEPVYFENEKRENDELLREIDKLRKEFGGKWDNDALSPEENFKIIQQKLLKIKKVYIPLIKRIASFYSKCLESEFYFCDSPKGENARKLMRKSIANVQELCEDLGKMISLEKESLKTISFNLLTLLQEVFDDIPADVKYRNEVTVSTYFCSSDRKALRDHVLMNIRENINTHAFGTLMYKKKHVWEKKVMVSVTGEKDMYTLIIANNGEPFTGNVSKIFVQGYHHGEMQHTGLGLYSAKKTVESIGGKISFKVADEAEYPTKYIIKIPKDYVKV